MEKGDLAVPIDDDICTELKCVVALGHGDALAGSKRSYAGPRHLRAEQPERTRATRTEGAVQRAAGVGDHEGVREAQLIPPACGPLGALRGDDDEPSAGRLDLGKGLHDTAEVGAADVSAGVTGEVDDGRMSEEIVLGDGLAVGVGEQECGKRGHGSEHTRDGT